MTNLQVKGEARVKFRNKRWWATMAGILLFAATGVKILGHVFGPQNLAEGRLDSQFAIWTSAFFTIVIILTALVYHRIIDEQEERAALWGMTLGFYAVSTGGFIWWFLARAGLVSPLSFIFVIIGGGLFGAAVQLWQQFR
jgi:hypothetical protein